MWQISSLMAATNGPVAEFSSFANFEERKRKSNFFMPFPKIVHQKGSFGRIRKTPLFRFCRLILDIFGLSLLIKLKHVAVSEHRQCTRRKWRFINRYREKS